MVTKLLTINLSKLIFEVGFDLLRISVLALAQWQGMSYKFYKNNLLCTGHNTLSKHFESLIWTKTYVDQKPYAIIKSPKETLWVNLKVKQLRHDFSLQG